MNSYISKFVFFVLAVCALALPKVHAEDAPVPQEFLQIIVSGGAWATGPVYVKNNHPTRSIRYNITVFEGFQAIGAVKGTVEPGDRNYIAEADRSVPGGRITKSFRIYTASYASPE